MSDSEDEDYAVFGSPLEPFDEDAVPRKKPFSVEDQIATDKHGRRRFHGAFTGGFSAGFFNSVGTLEGWKPSTFKSSRDERSTVKAQLPSHFMDDEDTDEFGIAPQVLRTKTEYASTKRNLKRRERESLLNSGPIPGEPVLDSILKPAKRTMGIILLIKMGWKPGQDIGERLQKRSDKIKSTDRVTNRKVYGCARGPTDSSFSSTVTREDSDSDVEDEIYRELGEKAPSFVSKEDTKGLGYKGLDRNTLNTATKSLKPLVLRDQFNKSIKISGQAFGIGAFEEDDDDIYAVDDKSQYDFSLEPLNQRAKKVKRNTPAVTDGSNIIIGFVKASFKEGVKQYPGPIVPASFTGTHVEKRSRFDVVPEGQMSEPRKQRLDADLRAVILDSERLPVRVKDETPDEEASCKTKETPSKPSRTEGGSSWKPFSLDSAKQERYEKYLHLIKIGAKDLVHTVLLNTMSDLERDSELREFECAARLYSGKLVSDRFTHGQSPDSEVDIKQESVEAERAKRKRVASDWSPHPLVCKRFNIKPPDSSTGITLQSVAESKGKPKFSVFDFLNASKSTEFVDMIESGSKGKFDDDNVSNNKTIECEVISGSAAVGAKASSKVSNTENVSGVTPEFKEKPESIPSLAEDDEFDEPADKMDLFKAIFLDSDEGSGDEAEKQDDENVDKNKPQSESISDIGDVNVLRNTSPPRGIFANLDLDKLSNRKAQTEKTGSKVLKLTAPPESIFENQLKFCSDSEVMIKTEPIEIPDDCYGPTLPSVPIDKPKNYVNVKLDVNDERWIEKPLKEKHHRSKHHHHHKKKHKKEKKNDKHKKKKKKRYSSSEPESSD